MLYLFMKGDLYGENWWRRNNNYVDNDNKDVNC